MDRYTLDKQLGEGSFGTVYLATNKMAGGKRAVKVLSGNYTWDEMVRMREVQSVMRLAKHPAIVALLEVHRSGDGIVSLVFEYMDGGSLHDFILKHKQSQAFIADPVVASLTLQALRGLQHLHDRDYMHRDLKPENLLLKQVKVNTDDSNASAVLLKLADFSLARGSHEATQAALTDYISTRWYRSPEILTMPDMLSPFPRRSNNNNNNNNNSELDHPGYTTSVDIFAMGCIVAEMFRLNALLPGKTELDQLQLIVNLLGPLPQCMVQHNNLRIDVQPQFQASCPRTRVEESLGSHASFAAKDFVYRMLALHPSERMTCQQAMEHTFLETATVPAVLNAVAMKPTPSPLKMVQSASNMNQHSLIGQTVHVTPATDFATEHPLSFYKLTKQSTTQTTTDENTDSSTISTTKGMVEKTTPAHVLLPSQQSRSFFQDTTNICPV